MAEKVQRKTPKSPRKRQWQRPRIKSGRLFETNSLACGKMFDDQCMTQTRPLLRPHEPSTAS